MAMPHVKLACKLRDFLFSSTLRESKCQSECGPDQRTSVQEGIGYIGCEKSSFERNPCICEQRGGLAQCNTPLVSNTWVHKS